MTRPVEDIDFYPFFILAHDSNSERMGIKASRRLRYSA